MLTNLAAACPSEFKLPPEVRQRREPAPALVAA
jgi:hypothetical protein